jgi:hypothetical protein
VEAEKAKVTILAAIWVRGQQRMEKELFQSSSSRFQDVGASTTRADSRATTSQRRFHHFPSSGKARIQDGCGPVYSRMHEWLIKRASQKKGGTGSKMSG